MGGKIHEATNQICNKRKQRLDTKGFYDYMIKADLFADMTLKALEERIRTLKMVGKIVNKEFNDADLYYIGKENFF